MTCPFGPSSRPRRAPSRASPAAATRGLAPPPLPDVVRRTGRAGCRETLIVLSSRSSGSRTSVEKNSITPTTPRGLRSGKPKAAWKPLRRAASARGKFESSGVSTIHAGSPVASTRPGSPSFRSEHEPLAQLLELVRILTRVPGPDAVKPPVLGRVRLPHRATLPADRAADRLQGRLVRVDRPLGFRENPGDRMLRTEEVSLGDQPPIPPGFAP